MSTNPIRIVHLTDIHVGSSHNNGVDVKPTGVTYEKEMSSSPLDYFHEHLETQLDPKPDLIFLGGDLVTGRDAVRDYAETSSLISTITARPKSFLNLAHDIEPGERFLVAPGNHDVRRGEDSACNEFKQAFGNYLTPYSAAVSDSGTRRYAPLYIFEGMKLAVFCLSTIEMSGRADENIEKVIDLVNKSGVNNPQAAELCSILEGIRFPDAASITAAQVKQFIDCNQRFANNVSDSEYYLKILLCHHPFLPVSTEEIEIKSFGGVLGGAQFMETASDFGYSVILHGHTHKFSYVEQHVGATSEGSGQANKMVHVGTPSLGTRGATNAYSVIDIVHTSEASRGTVYVRQYEPRRRDFNQKSSKSFDLRATASQERKNAMGSGFRILLDRDLLELVQEGEVIKSGDVQRIEAASYDCALGFEYKRGEEIFTLAGSKEGEAASVTLKPGDRVLFCTHEEFSLPNNMIFHCTVISRQMHKGLVAGISTFVDPGFKGRFYFPLTNVSEEDIVVSAKDPILSIEVLVLDSYAERGWTERRNIEKRKDF